MKRAFSLIGFLPAILFALPSGFHLAEGSASILGEGNGLLELSTGEAALIDWEAFSIGPSEKVQFFLPSESSVAVNRVTGSDPSLLFGSLISNGQIVLLNPNGLIVGKEARIDTASLIASTLDLNRDVFVSARRIALEGSSEASILCDGTIQGHFVELAARSVSHRGWIEARDSVVLAGAEKYGAGSIKLSAGSRCEVSGSILCPGGSIQVLAETCDAFESAHIDVSSSQGGGTIAFGGGRGGKDPLVPNALWTRIDKGASLLANGTGTASGGSVIIWGTQMAAMAGRLEAEGGCEGGFLELSSRDGLYFLGTVSTRAQQGRTGTFLLDPTNISIGTATDLGVVIGSPTTWTTASNPVNIAANTAAANISLALAGTNVSINTASLPDGGQAGNISVSSAITWSSMNTLTLTASNNITVGANIQHDMAIIGVPALTLTAANDIFINGGPGMNSVGSRNSETVVSAGRDIVLQGGNAALRGAQIGFFTPAAGTSTGRIQVAAGRNLSLLAAQAPTQIGHGQINFSAVGGVAVATSGAAISVSADGNILVQGGLNPFGASESQIGHGAFRLAGGAASNQDGDILVVAGGNLSLSAVLGGGPANIGHGTGQSPAAPIPLLSGNIDVQIRTDLTIATAGPHLSIGHFGETSGTAVDNIEGNIQVVAGQDISILTTANAAHTFIGHNAVTCLSVGMITPVQMRVAAGRDLVITNNGAFSVIGSGWRNVFSPDILVNLTLDLEVCRNVSLTTNVVTNRGIGIGNIANGTGAGMASTGEFYGSVGGNLSSASNGGAIQISSYGDFNLGVQGNISSAAANANIIMGPRGVSLGDFRMYAGGSILSSHTATGIVLYSVNPISLDFRAGGDIQIPNSAVVAAGQPISYQANNPFAAGELWTTNGAAPFAIATVCGEMTNIGLFTLFSNGCANADSPAIASPCGSVSLNRPAPGTIQFTTTGPLTITGGCTFCTAAPSNVTIGGTGDFNLGTPMASVAIGSFQNITLNDSFSTTAGPIVMSACDNLTILPGINLATAGASITLTADADNNGVGNLTLQGNLTSNGGPINLFAGPLATSGTSSIIQTGATLISSGGGNVVAEALLNITFTGTSPALMTTAGGSLSAAARLGTISLDENITTSNGDATLSAGLDILINPPGGTSVAGGSIATLAGNLSLFANNDIVVNGDAVSLDTTSGNILAIADFDNTGVGNATVNQTIASTTGNICVAAGPGTFGCSQNNCQSGLISGFPVGTCTVNIAGGSIVSTGGGTITLTSARDIIVNGLSPSISTAGSIALTAGLGDLTVQQQIISSGSSLTTFAGNDTILTQTVAAPLIQAAGEIRMITGLDMILGPNTAILSIGPGDQVTLIVDNIHPAIPAFPAAVSGSFTMLAGSSVDSGSPLRIFTAYSQVFGSGAGINFIDPTALLNGQNPYSAPYLYPITAFTDTPYEQWCVFFGCPSNYPFPQLGDPFTVFYKVCLAQIVPQAVEIVTEFLLDLHPYNEFPGWMERFWVQYERVENGRALPSSLDALPDEPYYFRRRHFTILNHPKSYTQLTQ